MTLPIPHESQQSAHLIRHSATLPTAQTLSPTTSRHFPRHAINHTPLHSRLSPSPPLALAQSNDTPALKLPRGSSPHTRPHPTPRHSPRHSRILRARPPLRDTHHETHATPLHTLTRYLHPRLHQGHPSTPSAVTPRHSARHKCPRPELPFPRSGLWLRCLVGPCDSAIDTVRPQGTLPC